MRLEINYKKKTVKNTKMWRLNNKQYSTKQPMGHWRNQRRNKKKYLETNTGIFCFENKNAMTKNLWDAARAVLRGNFIVRQAYLRKQVKSQVNNLTLHLKGL